VARTPLMNKIYNPAKDLQDADSTADDSSDKRTEMQLPDRPDRRVAARQELDIDLTVYGRSAYGAPFYDRAKAMVGNARGGLIIIPVPLTEGQDLLLINTATSCEQICTVVDVHIRDIQMSEVSVRFSSPNPSFWCTRATTRKD
jgi:hypothetical protein